MPADAWVKMACGMETREMTRNAREAATMGTMIAALQSQWWETRIFLNHLSFGSKEAFPSGTAQTLWRILMWACAYSRGMRDATQPGDHHRSNLDVIGKNGYFSIVDQRNSNPTSDGSSVTHEGL